VAQDVRCRFDECDEQRVGELSELDRLATAREPALPGVEHQVRKLVLGPCHIFVNTASMRDFTRSLVVLRAPFTLANVGRSSLTFMRRIALTSCGLLLALPLSAGATDAWKSVADVGEVTVRIHWVSSGELQAAARTMGKRADNTPFGFSVLRKHVDSGSFTCDVYVLHRPARIQDRATASLGHEIAHCLGFSHE